VLKYHVLGPASSVGVHPDDDDEGDQSHDAESEDH
jgi:hypothetical protein